MFEGSPRIFRVQGHDSRLSQVVNNLIYNARSFSPRNGKVRVTCRRSGRDILITVDDDGPGIRADAIDKIFDRFYTDRPHQTFGQNSGLGLFISKQIVEAHGGRLLAQNRVAPREPGASPAIEDRILGARFLVRLPAMM
jgi:two-component system sensor histidine kinase ChvG